MTEKWGRLGGGEGGGSKKEAASSVKGTAPTGILSYSGSGAYWRATRSWAWWALRSEGGEVKSGLGPRVEGAGLGNGQG